MYTHAISKNVNEVCQVVMSCSPAQSCSSQVHKFVYGVTMSLYCGNPCVVSTSMRWLVLSLLVN